MLVGFLPPAPAQVVRLVQGKSLVGELQVFRKGEAPPKVTLRTDRHRRYSGILHIPESVAALRYKLDVSIDDSARGEVEALVDTPAAQPFSRPFAAISSSTRPAPCGSRFDFLETRPAFELQRL